METTKFNEMEKWRTRDKKENGSNELYQEPTQEKLKPNLNSVKPMDCIKTYRLYNWEIDGKKCAIDCDSCKPYKIPFFSSEFRTKFSDILCVM